MFEFQKNETPWFVDIYLKNPKKLQEYLKEFNISTRLVYPPLNSLKIFKIKKVLKIQDIIVIEDFGYQAN